MNLANPFTKLRPCRKPSYSETSKVLESDVYKIRPNILNLYGSYFGDAGKSKQGKSVLGIPLGSPRNSGEVPTASKYTYGCEGIAVDVTKAAYNPKITQDIIETLFNPKPSASMRPSPFTYYQPMKVRQRPPPHPVVEGSWIDVNGSPSHASTSTRRTESLHSVTSQDTRVSDAQSIRPSTSSMRSRRSRASVDDKDESSVEYLAPQKHWWSALKIKRPTTPQTLGLERPRSPLPRTSGEREGPPPKPVIYAPSPTSNPFDFNLPSPPPTRSSTPVSQTRVSFGSPPSRTTSPLSRRPISPAR